MSLTYICQHVLKLGCLKTILEPSFLLCFVVLSIQTMAFVCKVAFNVVLHRVASKRLVLRSALGGTILCDVDLREFGDASELCTHDSVTKLKVLAAKLMPHEWLSFRCINATFHASESSVLVDVMYDESIANQVLRTYLHAKTLSIRRNNGLGMNTLVGSSVRVVLSEMEPNLIPEVLLKRTALEFTVHGYSIDTKPDVSLVAKLEASRLVFSKMTVDNLLSLMPSSVKHLSVDCVRVSHLDERFGVECFYVSDSFGFDDFFAKLRPVSKCLSFANQPNIVSPSVAKWADLSELSLDKCGSVDFSWLPSMLTDLAVLRTTVQMWRHTCEMRSLARLSLVQTYLEGMLPTQVSNLSNLTELRLRNNFLSNEIPSELFSLVKLESLDLSYNYIEGGISKEIRNLTQLRKLDLESNLLSKSIPTEIGKLSLLSDLCLGLNSLTGDIPTEVGNLSCLCVFTAFGNRLGGLPTQIGLLQNLVTLDLSDNNLHRAIPSELGWLHRARFIALSRNYLCGTIPSGLALKKTLHLDGNQLHGEVPNDLQLDNLYAGQNDLTACNLSSFGSLHFVLDGNMEFHFSSSHKHYNKFGHRVPNSEAAMWTN